MATVEIVYVPSADKPPLQAVVPFKPGMTVFHALEQSGFLAHFSPELIVPVGIFSKKASYDTRLQSGDRVELYRPLRLDPKERRRQRAARKTHQRPGA